MAATTTTPLIPFEAAPAAPKPDDIADDHSLLKIDQELDFLMEQIEESGEASKEAMDRLQLFCQAMNVKVDRIGRYLSVMETRAAHCKQEAARYAQRAKRAQSKIDRTKAMVLYYHPLPILKPEQPAYLKQQTRERAANNERKRNTHVEQSKNPAANAVGKPIGQVENRAWEKTCFQRHWSKVTSQLSSV